jgi:hypothetical protein
VSRSLFRRSGSGSEFCGHLGIDVILDSSDLDVVSGAEREHENGFAVEREVVGVEPRLHMRGMAPELSAHAQPITRALWTYMNPNAPRAFVQLTDFILWGGAR